MSDDRLLAPCTADLLRGWVGPVHGYVWDGIPVAAVSIGVIEDDGRAILWSKAGDAKVRPSDLSLDLSLAECRDRVARVLASREHDTTAPGWEGFATGWALIYDGDTTAGDMPPGIDWADDDLLDAQLPDGGSLVDAVALAAVWREVSRVG